MGATQGSTDSLTQSQLSAGLMGFISAAGLISNVIVILVICVLQEHKKTTHWYVLNLAAADSLFLILLPFNLIQSLWGEWKFGLPLCVLFQGTFYVNYYAGVLFLAVMSFDRYVAIAHPVSHSCRRLRSTRGSRLISFAVWVIAISASAPLMANTNVDGVCDFSFEYVHPECKANDIPFRHCDFWRKARQRSGMGMKNASSVEEYFYDLADDDYEYFYEGLEYSSETTVQSGFVPLKSLESDDSKACRHPKSSDYVTWIAGNFMLSFVVPLTVMAACYGGILWRIQHPKSSETIATVARRNASSKSRRQLNSLDKKVRITILVVSLVAIFAVCWLPFHVVILGKINGIDLPPEQCAKLEVAVLLIAYSNSLLNPLMYTFLGINFNKRLKTAIFRVFGRFSFHVKKSKDRRKNTSAASTKVAKVSSSENIPSRSGKVPMHPIVTDQRQHFQSYEDSREDSNVVASSKLMGSLNG